MSLKLALYCHPEHQRRIFMTKKLLFVQHGNEKVISLPAERIVRIVEEVVVKTEDNLIKFLTVNDKADIHK